MLDVDVQATSDGMVTIIDVEGPSEVVVVDTGAPSSTSRMSCDFGVELSSDILSLSGFWSPWVPVDLPILPVLCHLCHLWGDIISLSNF